MITLRNSSPTEVTVLSNLFIDNYMPKANGEFVKVYIYLLEPSPPAKSSDWSRWQTAFSVQKEILPAP